MTHPPKNNDLSQELSQNISGRIFFSLKNTIIENFLKNAEIFTRKTLLKGLRKGLNHIKSSVWCVECRPTLAAVFSNHVQAQ